MEHHIIGAIIFLWFSLMINQVFTHHYMITVMKTKPIYVQWFILRGMVAIFYGALFYLVDLWAYLPIFFFQVTSHFVIFNPMLNKLRKLDYWYLGEDSGWFDKWFSKDLTTYKVFYFSTLFVMVLSIIVIYDIYL